jgi:dephospho-CoA kinase
VPDKDSKQPLRIGLTGGIASGKSTVAEMFADLGVPVIDTDIIAREVVQPGEPALNEICERFGSQVINTDGELDRDALRNLIFSDTVARHDLEAILHPRIGAETRRQSSAAAGPYQLIVVPLLTGSQLIQFVNKILVVDCDEDIQIQRLIARDAETIDQAQRILSAQASRKERLVIADDVIRNDQSLAATRAQVLALDATYRQESEQG